MRDSAERVKDLPVMATPSSSMLSELGNPPPKEASREHLGRRRPIVLGATARNGALALADQFVVSGASFATTVIIGRVCGADELGVYALAFTLVVLIVCVQESLLATPYTVYCQRLDGPARAEYAGSILVHHVFLAAIIMVCLVLGGAGILAGTGLLRFAGVAWVLAAVVPLALLRDLVRRLSFAHMEMSTSLALDVGVAVLQIGGLVALAIAGWLSAGMAYAVMGASCAVALAGWFVFARASFVVRRERVLSDLRKNWAFGRWVFAAMITLMLQLSVVPWLLAAIRGAQAAGVFAACMSVVLLANPAIQGISNVLTPRAAMAFAQGGAAEVRRVVGKVTLLVAVAMILFCGVVMWIGGEIVSLLYGSEYAGYRMVIAVLAVAVLGRALGMAAYNGLRAVERPDVNLKTNLLGLAVTVGLCTVLTMQHGVLGAACGLAAGDVAAATLRWAAFL